VNETIPLSYESSPRARVLWPAYVCESLSSVGTTLLMVGIFFYTERNLNWGLKENFLLAAAQGVAYVGGSLLAQALVQRTGRRRGLIAVFSVLTFIPLIALAPLSPAMLVAMLLTYTFIAALNWPALESLVCSGADAHTLSRRVGIYNLVWSGTNAVTFALSGVIIEHWHGGIFALPAVVHAISAALMWMSRDIDPGGETASGHAEPEPQLLAQRTLAMWLARISLPATYVVVYALSAMMPLLPVMQPLDTTQRTLVGSTWMVARWLAFLLLGATTWWHTRPRILLLAAGGMLIAFIGVTIQPTRDQTTNLTSMIGWQIVLGVMMGIIYSGSLYFGMVLSEGSTEHGGYHEALIGLGSVLGPGTAALTQWRWPGDLHAGVAAVCAVITLTILAACVASVRARQRTAS
jgi:MFS family permease